jgi:glyoxylase-like metal-dependent hydrolase (beta-lactamase superfamily II)
MWQGLSLRAVALPGHGSNSLGFLVRDGETPLGLFSGDLICDPGVLVNMYDLEKSYGATRLFALPAVLRGAAELGAGWFFPATGPPLADGPGRARELAARIEAFQEACRWESGDFEPVPRPEPNKIGRYAELAPGVYQITNFGNCVVLIDEAGHGLFVDPGPCDFEDPQEKRVADFHADLDRLEREAGLRAIDAVLITHFHGDHIDMVPEVRRRYPQCRVAAWDLVARVLQAPWDYPYACLLPWYNLGLEQILVDEVISGQTPWNWRGHTVRACHLPGHCYVHAGYLLTFRGTRLAITGDALQSRGEAGGMNHIMANHSVPDAREGVLKTYRVLERETVDLNVGGHSSWARGCAELYRESRRRVEHALDWLTPLVPDGDLPRAFRRPHCPRLDPDA